MEGWGCFGISAVDRDEPRAYCARALLSRSMKIRGSHYMRLRQSLRGD